MFLFVDFRIHCFVCGQFEVVFQYYNNYFSTTISVLTGLIEMTSGSINIYNKNLSSDLQLIRQLTGICPQQNVLFLNLTVQEQLLFLGVIAKEIAFFKDNLHIFYGIFRMQSLGS